MTHYALLIGVRSSPLAPDKVMPRAVQTASALQSYLRVAGISTQVKLLEDPQSAQKVKTEFDDLVRDMTDDDTVIIAYVGHGMEGSGNEPPRWLLASNETISASALAAMLDGPPARARRIVISDCCYGQGVASLPQGARGTRGALIWLWHEIARLRHRLLLDYRNVARRFTESLMAQRSGKSAGAPMVCIAGASAIQETDDDRERLLILLVIGAAVAGSRNRELKNDFDRVKRQNTGFYLESNRSSLLDELVLGTGGAAAAAPPAAGSLAAGGQRP